ncbi:MAG: putative Transcriptional regulator, Crp/Fnr family [Dehalococcoidia bacterium]|nr:putative Transcriptional regulator, Crp/Fnr family [Dehalococcoidia bacterium]MBF8303866.1 putative Transcriptional regulator, Crp/Fnr family [Dehalococcoidia bacterium]
MAIVTELLESIPYFSGLTPQAREALSTAMFEKAVSRNEALLWEGDPGGPLYVVGKGRVKIFRTSAEGKEQVLRVMQPGDSFNEVPVFDGGNNPASAMAMEDGNVYGIRREDMQRILQGHPQLSVNIIRVLSRRLRELVSLVEDLSFRHVTGRLVKILLENAVETGRESPDRRLTQQQMAAMVGTAREMVGRSLKNLEAMGAIRVERQRIVIVNRDILKGLL